MTELSVMKNMDAKHAWQVTGRYDPEQDGPDPQWGRQAIECRRCGETRRIFCPLNDERVVYGCRRTGSDEWRPGDRLIVDGMYLDQFVCWLPDGLVRTHNTGGTYRVSEPSALYPA